MNLCFVEHPSLDTPSFKHRMRWNIQVGWILNSSKACDWPAGIGLCFLFGHHPVDGSSFLSHKVPLSHLDLEPHSHDSQAAIQRLHTFKACRWLYRSLSVGASSCDCHPSPLAAPSRLQPYAIIWACLWESIFSHTRLVIGISNCLPSLHRPWFSTPALLSLSLQFGAPVTTLFMNFEHSAPTLRHEPCIQKLIWCRSKPNLSHPTFKHNFDELALVFALAAWPHR